MAPSARKGPKGILLRIPFFESNNETVPSILPIKEETIIINRIDLHPPIQAPIIAISFISPPPIASFFTNNSKMTANRYKIPPPRITPINESYHVIWVKKKDIIRPKKIPGMDIISGII